MRRERDTHTPTHTTTERERERERNFYPPHFFTSSSCRLRPQLQCSSSFLHSMVPSLSALLDIDISQYSQFARASLHFLPTLPFPDGKFSSCCRAISFDICAHPGIPWSHSFFCSLRLSLSLSRCIHSMTGTTPHAPSALRWASNAPTSGLRYKSLWISLLVSIRKRRKFLRCDGRGEKRGDERGEDGGREILRERSG